MAVLIKIQVTVWLRGLVASCPRTYVTEYRLAV